MTVLAKKRSRKKTGSAVPFRVSQLILHTQTESGVVHSRAPLLPPASRDIDYDGVNLYRQPPSWRLPGHAIACRYSVRRREFPGTGPKNLNLSRATSPIFTKTCLSIYYAISSQNEASAAERYLSGGGWRVGV